MPVYIFEKPDGAIVERTMTVAELEQFLEETTWKQRIDLQMRGFDNVNARNWPKHCESSGCCMGQQAEFERRMTELGVPTKFDASGRAVYTSPRHRALALKARGMHDKDGGYSETV